MSAPITAMSYNVRYQNPANNVCKWADRCDEVAGVLRFHRPDVVGLQEIDYPQIDDLRERLDRFEWLSAGRREDGEAGELATVAYDAERFELRDDGTFWLSETPDEPGSVGWDAMLPRLVRYAKLRAVGSDVEFYHFNTHFDHAGERARIESALLLRDRIDELSPGSPVLLTGDFNCRPSTAPYEHIVASDSSVADRTLCDARESTDESHHGPTTTMTDFNDLVPNKKIDHLFVSSDVDVRQHGILSGTYGNGQYPSDHLPVLARLFVPER